MNNSQQRKVFRAMTVSALACPGLMAFDRSPQVVSLGPTAPDWSEDAVFAPFDTEGGTWRLTQVTLLVSGIYTGDHFLRNPNTQNAVSGITWHTPEWQVTVEVPDGSPPGTITAPPVKLQAGGSGLDLGPGASVNYSGLTVSAGPVQYTYTDSSFLAAFLNPTGVTLPVAVAALGTYGALAQGGKQVDFVPSNEEIGVTISLQYSYAVPEPQTYALIAGLGLLGFAVWRRQTARA